MIRISWLNIRSWSRFCCNFNDVHYFWNWSTWSYRYSRKLKLWRFWVLFVWSNPKLIMINTCNLVWHICCFAYKCETNIGFTWTRCFDCQYCIRIHLLCASRTFLLLIIWSIKMIHYEYGYLHSLNLHCNYFNLSSYRLVLRICEHSSSRI